MTLVFSTLASHALDATAGRRFHPHPRDPVLVSQDLVHHLVPFDGDVSGRGLLEEAVRKHLLPAEAVAAVDHGHMRGDMREVQGLLDGGVPTADHHDPLAFIEKPIAGRAGRDPATAVGGLGRQPEVLRRGPGGDDEGIASIAAGVAREHEGRAAEVGPGDMVGDDVRPEALGVAPHALHELGAL